MRKLDFIKRALVFVTLSAFAAPQAEAIEVFSAGTSATHLDDGWISQVRGGGGRGGGGMRHGGGGMHRGGGGMHRGGMHGGMNRGAMHGGMNRGGMHRGAYAGRGNVNRGAINRGNVNRGNVNRNVNRNMNRNVNRNVNVRTGYGWHGGAWAARPGWYRWPAGGAIAAGAALGFVSAAAAASWAGSPPAAGLCWYYTDASRQQGFWDQCP